SGRPTRDSEFSGMAYRAGHPPTHRIRCHELQPGQGRRLDASSYLAVSRWPGDIFAPEGAARLAKARPDLVEYHLFPDAGHTQEWNVDQVAYESILTSFLVRKLGIFAA